jgi:hypothetical protein
MAKKDEIAAQAERNLAEPIGTPPHGGNWTWDIPKQAWVEVSESTEASAA